MRSRQAEAPCCPVLVGKLKKEEAEELAETLKAIADPARLMLLNFIAAQPSGEACVCHFTEPLGLSQPTVSHHLKLLYGAGLLEREKRGAWVYYRIIPERLDALCGALSVPAARHKCSASEPKRALRQSRA
jgi:ArsR family transcriptional regulator, arsenate/arsenite/antimonite-responsive transcriptional repressor